MTRRFPTPCLLGALVLLAGCAASGGSDETAIGTAVYVGDAEVRPYRPEPALVTARTSVPRAKYPAVDVHCHWSLDVDPDDLLRAMDERNVRAAVNLSGGWGDELEAMLEKFHRRAPDRLLVFCNVDFSRAADPTFAEDAVAALADARRRGAAGLKVFKSLGLTTRDATGALVAIDDPRLDPVWEACGRLGMPVLIHAADPIAFFQPVDERNERWMQLTRHPDWSFHGPQFPDRDVVLAQRDRVIARHPRTMFIGAHVANSADDLARARRMLDAHPNLVVDISGRVGELGRQPYSARRLFLDYPDRILFGTDRYPGRADQPRYRIYFRFLETADEYFPPYDHPFPPSGDWEIHGMDLPDDVLRKVYSENWDRLLERAGASMRRRAAASSRPAANGR